MKLEQLIRGIAISDRRGCFEAEVQNLTADSRKVRRGDVFVAVPGTRNDGHAFIESALNQGACAVIAERWPDDLDARCEERTRVVLVPNSRRALALAAANLYGQPSLEMVVAGVTGTNGKTTVAYILESILLAAGKKAGLIGTVESRFDGKSRQLGHTTPDPVTLQRTLAEMTMADVSHVVMEVSSHALDQHRVAGVHFKVAGFTNLTQDHLDYHQSMERYFEAKASLFSRYMQRSLARGRMAIVNIDDPRGEDMIQAWGGKSLRVSAEGNREADLWVKESELRLDGSTVVVDTSKGPVQLETRLVGRHNLTNLLVAMGMAQAMGFSDSRIQAGLAQLSSVPGRLERVDLEARRQVFVDYAHTPDALRQVLASLRPLTSGRLVVVFGCGGNRDAQKRPAMGQAVAEGADLVVLTSDNPRDEEPQAIADAVREGLQSGGLSELQFDAAAPKEKPESRGYRVELDRWKAIELALAWARPDDVVVVAGKGHENRQDLGDRSIPFDDRDAVRRILMGLPPPPEPPPVPESAGNRSPPMESPEVLESVDIDPDIVDELKERALSEGELAEGGTSLPSDGLEPDLGSDSSPETTEGEVTVQPSAESGPGELESTGDPSRHPAAEGLDELDPKSGPNGADR